MRAAFCLALLAAACGGTVPAHGPTGDLSVALKQAPTDAGCLQVGLYGQTRTVYRTLQLSAGQSTVLVFKGLPTGQVLLTANAYPGDCSNVSEPPASWLIASWSAAPQTVAIPAGQSVALTVVLQRNGTATLGVDFQDDSRTVSTIAGSRGSADGTGAAAGFQFPTGFVADHRGNLYIADTYNSTIRKLVLSSRAVTTVAGTAGATGTADGTGAAARFTRPAGLAYDSACDCLYVADSGLIREIALGTAAVTTLAGNPATANTGLAPADGTGTAAVFGSYGQIWIAYDGNGNLYLADAAAYAVRKLVVATGAVTTIAGTLGVAAGRLDAAGAAARFGYFNGIGFDGTDVFVSDGAVRRVSLPGAQVTTIAGGNTSSAADGVGSQARFREPDAIAADGQGNLYVADSGDDTIRKVIVATGAVVTIAGASGVSGATDGTGSAARFYSPIGVALDGPDLYVLDSGNGLIRKL